MRNAITDQQTPSLPHLCRTLLWPTASQRVREGRWENRNQNQNQTKTNAMPPEQTHSKKITTGATIGAIDVQPNRFTRQSTDPPIQTHRSTDPNPPSTNPSPLIQTQPADPKSKTQHRCKPWTREIGEKEWGGRSYERQREEVRVKMRENKKGNQ